MFRGFSWKPVYHRYPIVRGRSVLSSSTGRTDLPIQPLSTLFNLLFRQQADVSLLRLPVTLYRSNGILTVSSIGFSFRMILRARLTLIRLALIRNPWSYGEGFLAPLSLLIPTFAFPGPPTYLKVYLRRRLECSPTNSSIP